MFKISEKLPKIEKFPQNKIANKIQLEHELKKLGYKLGKRIGEGSYSKVYFAQNFNLKSFACKIIDRSKTSSDFHEKFLPRELKIIKKLSHPNIVSVKAIFEMGPFICVFMDFCSHGDLLERIIKNGALPERKIKLFFGQITSAIYYLHTKEISHRDIKCENILIESSYLVKLTDFGFARKVIAKGKAIMSKTFCGSAAYASPEILKVCDFDFFLLELNYFLLFYRRLSMIQRKLICGQWDVFFIL